MAAALCAYIKSEDDDKRVIKVKVSQYSLMQVLMEAQVGKEMRGKIPDAIERINGWIATLSD